MTLVNTQLVGFGGQEPSSKFLYDIIQELGLTSNLVVCMDAADLRSYDGTSQTWTDIANGNNFTRGASTSSEASDPTFNGTAGVADESTYFSFDGGDYFENSTDGVPDTEAYAYNNATFTMLYVMWVPNMGGNEVIFDNTGGNNYILAYFASNEAINFAHTYSNLLFNETITSTVTATTSQWNFISWSYNEPGTTIDFVINANTSNHTTAASTFTGPYTDIARIGTNLSTSLPNTTRLACCAIWSTNLTTTQLNQIYTRLKARRFTSMP
jgi:hypothetical protein